ncbi:hypothetical protein Sps_04554 [Shewanella psychrophila]|uniref:Uncharacterized protein n=1 Tax=Shewanella psychrophila TaxID=225848 RepID=A0A1S6HVW8_9GAMM|nr:hypothetical protein Sps_04554 [Shewanella psychrophila]
METFLVVFLMMYFGEHKLNQEEVTLESKAAQIEQVQPAN